MFRGYFEACRNPSASGALKGCGKTCILDTKGHIFKGNRESAPIPHWCRQRPFPSTYSHDGENKTETKQTQKHRDKCGLGDLILRQLLSGHRQLCLPSPILPGFCLSWILGPEHWSSYLFLSTFSPCGLTGRRLSFNFTGHDTIYKYRITPHYLEKGSRNKTLLYQLLRLVSVSEILSWKTKQNKTKRWFLRKYSNK